MRGAKTMLDVLIPVQEALAAGGGIAEMRGVADAALAATRPMRATKGRAAFLGERSIGHLDPGARSSALLIHAVCDAAGGKMSDNVSIVIVSHSADVAKGAADMVRQMVGEEVRVAFCGGNPDGGLGTDVAAIMAAIESVYSPKGVAVLVDLGGAETNSEDGHRDAPRRPRRQCADLQCAGRRGRGDGRDGSRERRLA